MFTLVTDRSKYFRVKRGQTAEEVSKVLKTPVSGGVFAGRIIEVYCGELVKYSAAVGDTYSSVALKFGTDEERLKKINAYKPVYPTCKLFVPCKSPRNI